MCHVFYPHSIHTMTEKYSMLVVAHSNAAMKFKSWVHALIYSSIHSLLDLAGQAPDHIAFKPDEKLSDWLMDGCPVIFKSATLNPYKALLKKVEDSHLPHRYVTAGPGKTGKNMYALLVIGPCEDSTIQDLITDDLQEDGLEDVKLKWNEERDLHMLDDRLQIAIDAINESLELILELIEDGQIEWSYRYGVDLYGLEGRVYLERIKRHIQDKL